MKKRVVIHGANLYGQIIAMQMDYIFDIIAIFDRDKKLSMPGGEFCGIPFHNSLDAIRDMEFDFIFVCNIDYEGVWRDYAGFYGIPPEKIVNMHSGIQNAKRRTFSCLANEIYRLNIPGAAAELGIDYGDTSKNINFFFPDRKIYLFDTFAGFSPDDVAFERDLNSMAEDMTHYYDHGGHPVGTLLRRMPYPELCVLKPGVFPESLDGLEEQFAFVHIDCDLSRPIASALEYFYPRLSPGGFICVHDYFNPRFPGVRAVVRRFCDGNTAFPVPNAHYDGVVICKTTH